MKPKIKKGLSTIVVLLVLFSVLFPQPIYAEQLQTKEITLPESQSQSQTHTIDVSQIGKIKSITVDSGNVSYSREGNNLTVNLSNGEVDRSEWIPQKYSKSVTDYRTSSSQNGFGSSIPFSSGGYTGILYQNGSPEVISGSYVADQQKSASKTLTSSSTYFDSTTYYSDSYGYYGYISKSGSWYVYSSTTSPTLSKIVSVTDTWSWSGYAIWNKNTSSWDMTPYKTFPSNGYNYTYSDSSGYSGICVVRSGGMISGSPTVGGTYFKHVPGTTPGERKDWSETYRFVNNNCTVYKQGSTTTTYGQNYYGLVVKPGYDTRTWKQNYSGTVYQGAYDNYYHYKITIQYWNDETAPNLTVTTDNRLPSNQRVISYVAEDEESGIKKVTLPNGTTSTNPSSNYIVYENGTYTFEIENNVGLKTIKSINVSNVETEIPNTPSIIANESWSNQNQTVSISDRGDNGFSGVDRIEYSLSGSTSQNWKEYTSAFTITDEGETTITAKVFDKAGNLSQTVSKTVKIDKSLPSLTVTPSVYGLTNTELNLLVKASDLLSGIKRIKLPNGNYVYSPEITFRVGENGTYVFEAEDNVGNKTSFTSTVNNIKKNVLITNNRQVELELYAEDLYSGVTHMRLKNEEKAWSTWELYQLEKDWILSPVDGLKHVWIQYMDKVGNISEAIEDIIILDTTKPVIQFVKINNGDDYTKSQNVKLTVNASDSYTGMKDLYISNDNHNWTKVSYQSNEVDWALSNGDGIKTVYVKVSDTAGNISSVMTDTIFFDTTKPLANIIINNGDAYTPTREVKLTLSYSDIGGSGIETVKVIEGDKEYILPKPVPNSPTTINWTLDFGVSKTVSIVVVDKAGNISNIASDSIIVDKLTIKDFTLEEVVNPLEFNSKHPFTPKVWAFSPQPMIAGGNITFSIDVKSAFEPNMVEDKVDYKVEVIADNGYHKAFVGTMRKAGNHYTQTITIPKDVPTGAKVYASATAQRKLLISPFDTQTVYFPGGEDVSQRAQIGVVSGNIYDVIRFNEIQ
jgi:hypothetical protein